MKISIPDQGRFTTTNRARRFVRDGRAVWTDESQTAIRFVEGHHAHVSVQISAVFLCSHNPTDYGYDRVRRPLTRNELLAIPFVGDVDRLLNRGKQRRAGAKQAA